MGLRNSKKLPEGLGLDEKIHAAAEVIHNARSVSVFTGAGISVESGIPDFRSPGGLWSKYDPFTYCDYDVFQQKPHLFWQFARELMLETHAQCGGDVADFPAALEAGPAPEFSFGHAKPNPAHHAIVDIEKLGKLQGIVTQNVDGLHQQAGSTKVIEIHGTTRTTSCIGCKTQYEQSEVVRQWAEHARSNPGTSLKEDMFVPRCDKCTCPLKSDVTFFGEALPTGAMWASTKCVLASSVCLVVGSSLNVAPANMVPSMIRARGGTLIVVNLDTSGSDIADIFLQGRAGAVLPRLVQALRDLAHPQGKI